MPDSPPFITDWLTAIGTVGATVVALALAGRDQLKRVFFHPKLDVSIRAGPPDCHIIEETRQASFGPMGLLPVASIVFFCRLAIDNVGNRRATGVSVRLTKLWHRGESGQYSEDNDFLPMNLTWAHHLTSGNVVDRIDPQLPRHCNFCHFYRPIQGATKPPLLIFDTEVDPNEVGKDRWPTRKPSGKYRAEIAITADNSKTVRRKLDIDFTGEWFEDATEIARNSLKITVGH